MKTTILKNPTIKNILSALAVAVFGFILLNLTFILYYFFHSFIIKILRLFVTIGPESGPRWLPPLIHFSFLVFIGFISWFVLKSKMKVLLKTIYMTVPLAVLFVTLGIFLYNWPIAVYSLGALISAGILYYFYRTKQPWIYYYTLILVALALAIMTLMGVEI